MRKNKTPILLMSVAVIILVVLQHPFYGAEFELLIQQHMQEVGRTDIDEQAIKKVVSAYAETWNARDITAWGKLFTDDVDYVNRGGGWWKSNAENVSGHQFLFNNNPDWPDTYQVDVAKISFLKPDIALVHALWNWPGLRKAAKENGSFRGVMTLVLIRKDNQWLIRAVQNTVAH